MLIRKGEGLSKYSTELDMTLRGLARREFLISIAAIAASPSVSAQSSAATKELPKLSDSVAEWIANLEVGSRANYESHLTRPYWTGAGGVTIGIGRDLSR